MTAENPAACYALAKSIERSGMSFEALGVKEFGLGLVHLNVNLPYAEGYSGEMSSSYQATEKPLYQPLLSLYPIDADGNMTRSSSMKCCTLTMLY